MLYSIIYLIYCNNLAKAQDYYIQLINCTDYLIKEEKSIGDQEQAKILYQASIFALKFNDAWKNTAFCTSASMAAAKLATLSSLSQNDRADAARKSALHGNQNAGFLYAQFLEKGDGVLKDFISAYAWYNDVASYAAGARSQEAKAAMQRLETLLPIQSQLEAQARSRKIAEERKSRQGCRFFLE